MFSLSYMKRRVLMWALFAGSVMLILTYLSVVSYDDYTFASRGQRAILFVALLGGYVGSSLAYMYDPEEYEDRRLSVGSCLFFCLLLTLASESLVAAAFIFVVPTFCLCSWIVTRWWIMQAPDFLIYEPAS